MHPLAQVRPANFLLGGRAINRQTAIFVVVQRGKKKIQYRHSPNFASPFAHYGEVQILESGEGCTNDSSSSPEHASVVF